MKDIIESILESILPPIPKRKDWRIGCIGAGFIMSDCHLVAYREFGLNPIAIASRTRKSADETAKRHGITKVYDTWLELLQDNSIEILDIAIPPHEQLKVIREAVKHKNIKGILCQKPLAMTLDDAKEIVKLAKDSGIALAVNSNMRYDQSMRALKYLLDKDLLGKPVLATIEMRAIPHWQNFLKDYDKLELYGMGIHHIDIFRFLFGNPEKITAICRKDPRTSFTHLDGITQYTFKYDNEMLASSLDDVWAWPNSPCEKDMYIKWRVEGEKGMATGSIGWPSYPLREPSTLRFTSHDFPNEWIEPLWEQVWFPDAFKGTMSSLLVAIENGEIPEICGEDNLFTIACVEACYRSISEERTVALKEIYNGERGVIYD